MKDFSLWKHSGTKGALKAILQMRVDKNNLQKTKNVVITSMNKVLITGCFGYSVGTAKSFTISVMI